MVSVCMAAYNGERYIAEQIESILNNLEADDELLISDDGSMDRTIEIVKEFQEKDSRIILLKGPGKGVIWNFEFLLKRAKGDILFLADQDDVWTPNKVSRVKQVFDEKGCMVVIHDAKIIDEDGKTVYPSFFALRGSRAGVVKNIWKNAYIGCCMAMKRELLDHVLPIPKSIEMHDQWIGVIGELSKGSVFLPEQLFFYRRHADNVTAMSHYPVPKMIRNRVVFCVELLKRFIRNSKRL